MRLDLFLHRSRLIRRRAQSKSFCEAGAVRLNGGVAKASKIVKVGDRISIEFWNRRVEVEVTEAVERARQRGAPSRAGYDVVNEERKDLLQDGPTPGAAEPERGWPGVQPSGPDTTDDREGMK